MVVTVPVFCSALFDLTTYGGRPVQLGGPQGPPRKNKDKRIKPIHLTRTAPSHRYESPEETRRRLEFNKRVHHAHRVMGVDNQWKF